jgi:hypothetical protein
MKAVLDLISYGEGAVKFHMGPAPDVVGDYCDTMLYLGPDKAISCESMNIRLGQEDFNALGTWTILCTDFHYDAAERPERLIIQSECSVFVLEQMSDKKLSVKACYSGGQTSEATLTMAEAFCFYGDVDDIDRLCGWPA